MISSNMETDARAKYEALNEKLSFYFNAHDNDVGKAIETLEIDELTFRGIKERLSALKKDDFELKIINNE